MGFSEVGAEVCSEVDPVKPILRVLCCTSVITAIFGAKYVWIECSLDCSSLVSSEKSSRVGAPFLFAFASFGGRGGLRGGFGRN